MKSHFGHTIHYFCLEFLVCIHSLLPFYYNFFGKYISKVCKVYSEEFSIGNGRFYTFVSAHKAICYGCSAQSLIIFKEVPYPHSGTLQHQANLKAFFYQLTNLEENCKFWMSSALRKTEGNPDFEDVATLKDENPRFYFTRKLTKQEWKGF